MRMILGFSLHWWGLKRSSGVPRMIGGRGENTDEVRPQGLSAPIRADLQNSWIPDNGSHNILSGKDISQLKELSRIRQKFSHHRST